MGMTASGLPAMAFTASPVAVEGGSLPLRGAVPSARHIVVPVPHAQAATPSNNLEMSPLATAVAAVAALSVVSKNGRRGRAAQMTMRAGFGPSSPDAERREDIKKSEIGSRISQVVREEAKGMTRQLEQYGFSQVDGFLGGSIHGYPDQIRKEMKAMFDRGWFESEDEEQASFKVGEYRIQNQDSDNRFRCKLLGGSGDPTLEKNIEKQYDVAPTLTDFVRSLVVAMAEPMAKPSKTALKNDTASAEMFVLCGEGSRYDRRVCNEFGWNTDKGFVRDPRKLTAIYFCNPNYKPEHGGTLQLEGVITPTGGASIAPVHDRLVVFWADKTVWSVLPSTAGMISEHQYGIILNWLAKDKTKIAYNAKNIAHWFPELNGKEITWPPPELAGMVEEDPMEDLNELMGKMVAN
eukprot:TRINITY_DN17095_c0_g1_i1.p1 TRINITY_DN17095_c0_g1~~TRINITY_DN17095_c0_g1_i1.p1  ORF type:complete len:407 (+),score=87.66 TRINITY_DN17095_c0_g1_i1:146-1366(+)